MRKILTILILLVISTLLISCDIDLSDTSHDDDYIIVSTYYEYDEQNDEVIKLYYVPKITTSLTFYTFELDELEKVDEIYEVNYGLRDNYFIKSDEPIELHAVKQLKWDSIPEKYWLGSTDKRLEDDVLTTYGDLPIISINYELYDVIRVIYQDSNLYLHYILVRENNYLFIRYGDLRKLI
jgi:hypothetical protein